MTTQDVRCGEVGGESGNEACTYDKQHKGPHSWDKETLAELSKRDLAQAEKDKEAEDSGRTEPTKDSGERR